MQVFWFGIIAVLWAGFFVLEGFDYGVGILLRVIGRTEEERKITMRTIGPVWDGNEVWLLTAGGATFAAFPEWYASLFSGFYIAFALLLVGLIIRGIGVEYRAKAKSAAGRTWCDVGIILGSFLPALLLGVAFANIVRGVDMDAGHNMTGSFFALLNPYALLGGLFTLSFFIYHGALFLSLRTVDDLRDRAHMIANRMFPVVTVLGVAFLVWSAFVRHTPVSIIVSALIALLVLFSGFAIRSRQEGPAFAANAVVAILVPVCIFAAIYPNVLPARNNDAYSLTIHNASSSHYTLVVMTVVALIFTPIVLVYQAWAYWVFRSRITGTDVAGDSYGGHIVSRAMDSARTNLGINGPAKNSEPDTAESADTATESQ